MAQIIVLTKEAKSVLQKVIFKAINEMPPNIGQGSINECDLDTLHGIYSDVVSSKR